MLLAVSWNSSPHHFGVCPPTPSLEIWRSRTPPPLLAVRASLAYMRGTELGMTVAGVGPGKLPSMPFVTTSPPD